MTDRTAPSEAVLRIDVVSLFPETITAALAASIPARAIERGLASLTTHDLREWGIGKHRAVDDAPYGGGAGMLLRPEPLVAAIDALRTPEATVILLDAGGERLGQARARDLASRRHLIILCGRYEGVDDRVRGYVDLELSLGDFVTYSLLIALIVMPLRMLGGWIGDTQRFVASSQRIFQILDMQADIEDAPDALPLPAGASLPLMLCELFDIALQVRNAIADLPAIGFQFCFSGSSRTDASAEP